MMINSKITGNIMHKTMSNKKLVFDMTLRIVLICPEKQL